MYHLFLEMDDVSELSVWTELRITSQILKKFLDWIMGLALQSAYMIMSVREPMENMR